MADVEQTAINIVDDIVADLTDRRGFRQAWDDVDAEIRDEIRETWKRIVRKELGSRLKAELMNNHVVVSSRTTVHEYNKICAAHGFCEATPAPNSCLMCRWRKTCGYSDLKHSKEDRNYGPCILGLMSDGKEHFSKIGA